MKLLQISKNQIKITLSRQDLIQYDLTVQTMDYNTTKTRKAIWEIFDHAKAQTGFDAAKSRVSIKVYPRTDGGCDMYVSKLFSKGSYYDFPTPLHAVKSKFKYVENLYAFRFSSYEDLYCTCRFLPPHIPSALYLESDGSYILLLTKNSHLRSEFIRCAEYAHKIKCRYLQSYLNERCKLLCDKNVISYIMGKKSGTD